MNKYLIFFILILFSSCTSNPFWEDSASKKINIQGHIDTQSGVSDVPAFVFVENLNISTYTDISGFFSIDFPSLEMADGVFSGAVKVYYYIHNYKIAYSTLYITNGRLTSEQIDFDENGVLINIINLKELASFDLSIDNIWDRTNGDTLKLSLTINSKNYPFSYFSYVDIQSNPRRYIPSGVLLKSKTNQAVYYDKNNTDFLQKTDVSLNETKVLDFKVAPNDFSPFIIDDYILLEQQLVQSGEHEVLPYIHIIQDDIPDELFESIGIQNAAIIGESYLKMPIEIMKETLLIQ
ncbi:MAG: hypothetical protein P8O00_01085 [Candidatus Marinimicrobia bacterium]|nr:hypothetical protein [Candidatus Neomarinimicrobiota bacterium]